MDLTGTLVDGADLHSAMAGGPSMFEQFDQFGMGDPSMGDQFDMAGPRGPVIDVDVVEPQADADHGERGQANAG